MLIVIFIVILAAVVAMFIWTTHSLREARVLRRIFAGVNILFLASILLCFGVICTDNMRTPKLDDDEYNVTDGNILFTDYVYAGVEDGNIIIDVQGYDSDWVTYPADSVRVDGNISEGDNVRIYLDKDTDLPVRIVKDYRLDAIAGIILTMMIACVVDPVFFVVTLVKKLKGSNPGENT